MTEGFWWALWAKPISFHHHLSWPATKGKLFYGQVKSQLGPASQVLCRACAPWAALFWEESLLQSQLLVLGVESLGFQ